MSEIPDLRPLELREAKRLRDKVLKHVKFDACIVGVGERAPHGEVRPLRATCLGLSREALNEYATVAQHDMAAQLFACNPTSVLNVSAFDSYPPLHGTGYAKHVGAYLRKHGLAHLCFCGVSSSRGLMWMTLYRLMEPQQLLALERSIRTALRSRKAGDKGDPVNVVLGDFRKKAFSPSDAETAGHLIRGGLYEMQLKCRFPSEPSRLTVEQYEILALTPSELDVALRWVRGHSVEEIGKARGAVATTVEEQLVEIRRLFPRMPDLANRVLGLALEVRSVMGKRREGNGIGKAKRPAEELGGTAAERSERRSDERSDEGMNERSKDPTEETFLALTQAFRRLPEPNDS